MPEKSPVPVQEEATATLDALTQAIELLHGKVEAKRASLASIEEGREANPEGYEHWRKFYSHGLPELIANESELRSLASALPGLLEASRHLNDPNYQYAGTPIHRAAILCRNKEIDELRDSLSVSIRERETLTAELEKFQDWFQNAEQARAVAESRREQAIQDIEALPTFRVGKAGGLPEAVSRSAVLSIVRGSKT